MKLIYNIIVNWLLEQRTASKNLETKIMKYYSNKNFKILLIKLTKTLRKLMNFRQFTGMYILMF